MLLKTPNLIRIRPEAESANSTTSETCTAETSRQVDKSGDRIQKMFGEISGRYDFLNHFLSGGVDYYWRWRTVRRIRPDGDSPILDVCTGTGDLAIAFWKKAGGATAVVGTDFTPEMLDIARVKTAKMGIPADAASAKANGFFVQHEGSADVSTSGHDGTST